MRKLKCSRCNKKTNNTYKFFWKTVKSTSRLVLCPHCRRWALNLLFFDEVLGYTNFDEVRFKAKEMSKYLLCKQHQ